ncbi:MAG: thiol protease/hemagglutinin PrtT [Prevotella sp.]|uniref:thiol protease/hemagglutinin PrtT n=1 Tax=Prevotella sp. TaxID=59823 RepID=UPI002A2CE30D|nr:thiol protease/hemagglutinin PrtT [Prevotella sp.]MDD7318936.1 thiol protease/hemagglutinin PrtT [Prevotellaceae bacterium]MDY4019962.1 thiol protease/hemagglutinin PrtT [Prevotella sp.]
MKRILSILLLLITMLPASVFAKKVSQAEARLLAERFLNRNIPGSTKAKLLDIPQRLNIRKSPQQGYAPYYIYNAGNGKGFVIVSGDDEVADILAYSTESSFDFENAPDNLVAWMQFYADVIENGTFESLASRNFANEPGTPVVNPLLEDTEWGQDAPFNLKCPKYKNDEGKDVNYYVGCVATAMAQIMRFHKYPEHGTGTYSYTSNVGTLTADFGSTTYDWSKMPARLEKNNADQDQNDAVATLCSQLGISVNMTYMPGGSGAFSQMVTGALVKYFGYDKGMSYKVRDYYTTPEWIQMIKNELNAGRPLYYSASNEDGMGGHAFVCDGYDSNDFVHINWGWYGKSNGYFMVNAMNPYDLGIGANGGGYNLGQEIIVGIKPATTANKKGDWPVYGASRLAVFPYGSTNIMFQYMSFVENHDTETFTGKIAAVLEKDGQIVKVLKEDNISIRGIDPSSAQLIGAIQYSMKDISEKVNGVEDGQYRTMFAIKADGETEYTRLRHSNNLPAYANVTITGGKMTAEMNTPVPDVTLLEKISTDGDLYAKGSGAFRLNIKNNSDDFYLNKVMLKFTSVDNPEKSYIIGEAGNSTKRVYDNSEKVITLIASLPEDLQPGMYDVTAFEDKYEAYPFKDDAVGRATMEVKGEATTPIIRQTKQYLWIGYPSYVPEVKQGDKILASHGVRNYGVEGCVNMLMKLEKADDATASYPFILTKESFKSGEERSVMYYNRVDMDPGQYKIRTYYITEEGQKAVENSFEDCIVEVQENPDLVLECEKFTLPRQMQKGVKVPFSITLKAKQDFTRKLYIRMRPITGTGGEAVHIEFSLKMTAGETKTISKNYTPALDDGDYFVIIETQKDKETYENVGKYVNYGGIYTIGNVSGIADATAASSDILVTFHDNGHAVTIDCAGDKGCAEKVEVFSMSGTKVLSVVPTGKTVSLPLAAGVYVLSVENAKGKTTRKFVVR